MILLKKLPESVKDNLPTPAQQIFKKAFNTGWEEYKAPEDRKDDSSREETAFKVAGSAVKQNYHKNNSGIWIKNRD